MFKNRQVIPTLTAEEMHYAMTVHGATYSGRMQSEPVGKNTRPLEIDGSYLVPTDIPLNRAALAILESMKHDPDKAAAALYRIMTLAFDVLRAPEAKEWTRKTPDGRDEISSALVEALATVPTKFGAKVTPARLFKLAKKIRDSEDSEK